uniref:Uncharacterized protein n=1 Tax=viral metagenome TaxID=1070528 RepID=A0A6M3JXY2_9ZZZZ
MEWLVFSGITLAVLSALTWGAYKYGRIKEKQKTDAGKADDMAADAAIAAKPGIDNPLAGMRPR